MKTKAKRRHRLSALVAVLCIAAILASFGTFFASAGGYDGPDPTDEVIVGDWGIVIFPAVEDYDGEDIEPMVCINAYFGSDTRIVIPAEIGGYKINCVGNYWWGCGCHGFNCYRGNVTPYPDSASYDGGEFANETITEIVISEGIRYISVDAFSNTRSATAFTNLKRITIPENVTEIGSSAFANCTSLESITVPNSVTRIGKLAFADCTSLADIHLPDSLTKVSSSIVRDTLYYNTESNWSDSVLYLGNYLLEANVEELPSQCAVRPGTKVIADWAFASNLTDCPLTSVILPEGVLTIGDYAFYWCENLTKITLPNSLTSIGVEAFSCCDSLTEVTIPKGVTSIAGGAFGVCESLARIDVDSQNTVYSSKDGVLFNKAQTELLNYPDGKSDANYTIPQGVTRFGQAFVGNDSLTEITIPGSVKYIEDSAFYGCNNLTKVILQEGVTSIGEDVCSLFEESSNLTEIIIPRSVTSIDKDAFVECDNLTIYGYSGSYAESYAKENGFAFIALAELHDAKSGITVAADDVNVFPENAELAVSVVDTANDRITYDISLQAGGKEIRPNGSVTVKIPVPETMDGASVKVYRQEADGTLTDMHAIFQDGYAVFTTDHFSRYILEGEAAKTPSTPTDPAKPTDPTQPTQPTDPANPQPGQSGTTQAPANNAHTDIPKTGSASNALAGACAFMLAIAAVGALGLKKAYRKKKAQA